MNVSHPGIPLGECRPRGHREDMSWIEMAVLGVALLAVCSCAGAPVRNDSHSFEAFRTEIEAGALELMNGDTGRWEAVYSHAPDATLFGGWGGHEKGWPELAARWQMVMGR